MKNMIKMSAISGIVAFFVSIHPMERFIKKYLPSSCAIVELSCSQQVSAQDDDSLPLDYAIPLNKINQGIDLLSNMHNLTIYRLNDERTMASLFDDQLLSDENFPLSLSIIQVLESDIKKGGKILKAIGGAVRQGTRLTSKCRFLPTFSKPLTYQRNVCIKFNRSNENPISVFEVMENWIKKRKCHLTYEKTKHFTATRKSVVQTIFKATDERKSYVDDKLKNDIDSTFNIKAPQVVIDLIFSLLGDKENRALIEQAKQEFK